MRDDARARCTRARTRRCVDAAQGDRPAQPPRLVELPDLPRLRPRLEVPELRRHARPAPRRRAARLPPLRPPRAACPRAARLRVGLDRAARRPAPSGSRRSSPRPPVFRLDADVAQPGGRAARASRPRRAGVLVGTQMVAKGHDFPDVTLGVVLDADATLRFPDFRAEERTFALVAQLAGRAGRGGDGGRVLVQTLAPDAPSIRLAAAPRRDGFLAGELERRDALRYPPFSTLIRVVCSSSEPGAAHAAAARGARRGLGAGRASARRRSSACAGRSAARSSSRPPTAPARSPPSAPPSTRSRRPRAPRRGVQRRRGPAVSSAAAISLSPVTKAANSARLIVIGSAS